MCGIVGYVGDKDAPPIVLSGLKRLEYRGYDSAGVATLQVNGSKDAHIKLKRCEGKLENLVQSLKADPLHGTTSIGHTRWATHGKPSEKNAHPHRYKDVVIVHNGIIENYAELKADLVKRGHHFSSDTDSEVIAHRLQFYLEKNSDFEKAAKKLVQELKGAFAIAAIWAKNPNLLFVAKQECPMVLGLGDNEQFIASDIPALLDYTRNFIFLQDGEMAFVSSQSVVVQTFDGKLIKRAPKRIDWSYAMAEKEGYPHFMLKEIYEQPHVIRDTLRERIKAGFNGIEFATVNWKPSVWKKLDSLSLIGCGTAWHAGLIGKYWIERFANLHVEVDLASEYRYRKPVPLKNSACIAISQSGETADTLAALAEAMKMKLPALSITNTVESSIVRKSKSVIYTHAGLEIAVASTKCFLAQLSVFALLGLHLAEIRKTQSKAWLKKMLKELSEIPQAVEETLKLNDQIKALAEKYKNSKQFFYLGRGMSYPVALEGALKLKEIAYINTQAYPAGEMKHGPIALISEEWPIVCIAPEAQILDKMISNIQEVKARGGRPIVIGPKNATELERLADDYIALADIRDEWAPFLSTVVLQFFSYYMSVLNGCDVDKPRNLAKSVTVE